MILVWIHQKCRRISLRSKSHHIQYKRLVTRVRISINNWTQRWTTGLLCYNLTALSNFGLCIIMDLVSILRSLLRSARGGNWKLIIQYLHQMLVYLAASGHNDYTKSFLHYLEKMDKLEDTHPSVYAKFRKDCLFSTAETAVY